jgi:hypothetical protein
MVQAFLNIINDNKWRKEYNMQTYQKTLHLNPRGVLFVLNNGQIDNAADAARHLVQSYQFPTGLILQVSVCSSDNTTLGFVAYLWDANSNLINMSDVHTEYLGKYTVTNPYTQDVYTLILDDNCKGWITTNTEGYVVNYNAFHATMCTQLYMPKSEVHRLNILLQTPVEAHGKLTHTNKTLWERYVPIDMEGFYYMIMSIEADITEDYPYVQLQVLCADDLLAQVGVHKATENKPANILGVYEFSENYESDLLTDFYIGTTEK